MLCIFVVCGWLNVHNHVFGLLSLVHAGDMSETLWFALDITLVLHHFFGHVLVDAAHVVKSALNPTLLGFSLALTFLLFFSSSSQSTSHVGYFHREKVNVCVVR